MVTTAAVFDIFQKKNSLLEAAVAYYVFEEMAKAEGRVR